MRGISSAITATHAGLSDLAGQLSPLANGRGGFTGFSGGTASSAFVQGGPDGWRFDPAIYVYTDTDHVHAVTAIGSLGTFAYDANGNMTVRVEGGTTYTQNFDAENRLVSVAVSGVVTPTVYQYDANGQLIKKIAPDDTATLYLGLMEHELTSAYAVTHTTCYYAVPGARVVRVDAKVSYVLTDHLGSSSVTLDESGNLDGALRYYAYGETRVSSGTIPTERMFTGQVRQDDIGLNYFNARWYSPLLNRWIQPDVIAPNARNPQNLNRYAFVLNNPIRYRDPTGHIACDDWNACGGCVRTQRRQVYWVNLKVERGARPWTATDKATIQQGVVAIGTAMAKAVQAEKLGKLQDWGIRELPTCYGAVCVQCRFLEA